MKMGEMEAGGEVFWSPDPGSVEAMRCVCHMMRGAKQQVTPS